MPFPFFRSGLVFATIPANTVLPVISGDPTEGETLSTTNGTWTNTPTAYTYQWEADGVAIGGATASTYELTASEIGADITVVVTASNPNGSAFAESAAVGPVVAAGDPYFSSVVLLLPLEGDSAGRSLRLASEQSNSPHEITIVGGVYSTAQEPYGTGSFALDGNDYATAPDHADFEFASGTAFTVEFWLRLDAIGAQQNPIANYNGPGNGTGWYIGINTTGTVKAVTYDNTTHYTTTSTATVSAATWTHIAYSRNSSNVARLRINGVMDGKDTRAYSIGSNFNSLQIGRLTLTDGRYVTGYMKGVRITKGVDRYDTDSTVTIDADYYPTQNDDPNWSSVVLLAEFEDTNTVIDTDLSPTTPHTITGNLTYISPGVDPPFGLGALYLPGVISGYAQAPTDTDWDFGSGNYTVEAWVRPDNLTGEQHIIGCWHTAPNRSFVLGHTAGELQWTTSTDGNSAVVDMSGGLLVVSTWAHVAVSYNGTKQRLRINGVIVDSNTVTKTLSANGAQLGIGASSTGATRFTGQIKGVRITKGVDRYDTDSNVTIPLEAWPTE